MLPDLLRPFRFRSDFQIIGQRMSRRLEALFRFVGTGFVGGFVNDPMDVVILNSFLEWCQIFHSGFGRCIHFDFFVKRERNLCPYLGWDLLRR